MKAEIESMEGGEELLLWVRDAAAKGGEFVAEHAPALAQEVVAWQFWAAVLGLVLAALIGSFGLLVASVSVKSKDSDVAGFQAVVAFLAFGLALGIGGGNTYHLIESIVAPRVIVVEYVADVLK